MRIRSRAWAASLLTAGLLVASVGPVWAQEETAPEPPEEIDLPALLEKVTPSLVMIESITQIQDRSGRLREIEGTDFGVIVDAEGTVVTAGGFYVEDPRFSIPNNIVVTLSSGEKVDAEFLGKDEETDLAFIRLAREGDPLPHVDFTQAVPAELGDEVVVFGTLPRSYQFERKFILTRVNAIVTKPKPMLALMHDVSGSVAGPVFTRSGTPVGLVSPSSRRGSSGGSSFVMPAESFLKVLKTPPRHEAKESRAWLGLSYQILNEKLAVMLGIPGRTGVVVNRVYPGMPGALAGIQVDDAIVEMAGKEIPASREEEDGEVFTDMIREQEVGATIPLKVVREGKEMEVEVTLQERPKSKAEAKRYDVKALGLVVREITFFDTVDLNLDTDEEGVIVQAVEPALPAGLAKVQVEDVVKKVDGVAIVGVDDFQRSIEAAAGQAVVLFLKRDHLTKFIQIK